MQTRPGQSHLPANRPEQFEGVVRIAAEAGISPKEFVLHFRNSLRATPDPDRALRNYERFLHAGFTTSVVRDFHAHPVLEEVFLQLAAQSQYLADILVRSPELLHWLTASGALTHTVSRSEYLKEADRTVRLFERKEKRLNALKRLHRREMLRIGAREVLGEATGAVVAGELAALADATVGAIMRIAQDEIRTETSSLPDPHLAVFGLGKLGGEELNFSSDIDLMFVYDTDADLDVSPGGIQTLHELCARIVESTVRMLTEHTGEGYLYRVDLRLRPDGQAGPLAMSRQGSMTYYESRGELWERQMLIKARVIAGDAAVGERLLRDLRPFIYPRTHLRSPLEEIAAIKRRIEEKVAGRENIKLGAGGIRDIEFIVQGLQLLNGGAKERIRERSTLPALDRLQEERLLSPSDAGKLKKAYVFLRAVEHRLQLLEGRQTHSLPETTEEIALLARRLKFGSAASFRRMLESHRNLVRKLFAQTTATATRAAGRKSRTAAGDPISSILADLRLKPDDQRRKEAELLRQLLPSMVDGGVRKPFVRSFLSVRGGPEAFSRFVALAQAEPIRRSMSIAVSNERFLDLLVRVSARSASLTQAFIAEPLLFESLVGRPGEMLGASPAWEFVRLSDPGRYKKYNDARILLRFLTDVTTVEGATAEFSAMADTLLEGAAREAIAETKIERAPLFIALGKLGGNELGYGSDLDIICLSVTDNGSVQTQADRFARRVIAALTERIPPMYRVDFRLRPEGHNAPIVTNATFFKEYFRSRAALWERQSLIRARVLTGTSSERVVAQGLIREALAGTGLPSDWLGELRMMRDRIARERGKGARGSIDLKTGEGGLLDVEFSVQALQLAETMKVGSQPVPGTIMAIRHFASVGRLRKTAARKFEEGYLWLRRLELFGKMQSMMLPFRWPFPAEVADAIAAAMDEASPATLERRLNSILKTNRSMMVSIFDELRKRDI